ncbi:MAG: hypothetical protein HYV07_07390 [Deltaproteobacteria bacterium]|nr:hypothetical protein [Deltaproteobacteria bacterium]
MTAGSGALFETFARDLESLLDAKDPRRLAASAPRGSVLLMFPGAGANGATACITVRIDRKIVQVVRGGRSIPGLPVALARVRLEAG